MNHSKAQLTPAQLAERRLTRAAVAFMAGVIVSGVIAFTPEESMNGFVEDLRDKLGLQRHAIERGLAKRFLGSGKFNGLVAERPAPYHLPRSWKPKDSEQALRGASEHADRLGMYEFYGVKPPHVSYLASYPRYNDLDFGYELRTIRLGMPEVFLSEESRAAFERPHADKLAEDYYFASQEHETHHFPLALAKALVENRDGLHKSADWLAEAAKRRHWWKLHKVGAPVWKYPPTDQTWRREMERLRILLQNRPDVFLTYKQAKALPLAREIQLRDGTRIRYVSDWLDYFETGAGTLLEKYADAMRQVETLDVSPEPRPQTPSPRRKNVRN